MGTLSQLLKWNKPLDLKDPQGRTIKSVWIRIIDDDQLKDAYQDARIASGARRHALRDTESKDYKDDILPILEASREQCYELIRAARGNTYTANAFSEVVRPDLPKLEEVAVDPDAASLEEQEKFDQLTLQTELDYRAAIDRFVEDRLLSLTSELDGMSDQELRDVAMDETANIMALSEFLVRVLDEKAWRAVYEDKKFSIHGFDDYNDFYRTDDDLKRQIRNAYQELEVNGEELKN